MADLRPTTEMRRGIGLGSLDTQRPASAPDRQPLRKKRAVDSRAYGATCVATA
jgi:hypothetical protein